MMRKIKMAKTIKNAAFCVKMFRVDSEKINNKVGEQ